MRITFTVSDPLIVKDLLLSSFNNINVEIDGNDVIVDADDDVCDMIEDLVDSIK